MAKTTRATRTAQAKKSSMKPTQSQVPMQRDVEVLVEEVAVGLDDGEQQDGEAPHGEEVGQAGDRPLQELALAGHLDGLGLHLGPMLPRVRLGSFFPERMSLDSQWNRRAAMPNPMTVTKSPMMILTGTNAPRLRLLPGYLRTGRRRGCERHLGFQCGPEDSGAAPGGVVGGPAAGFPSSRRRPLDARLGVASKRPGPRPQLKTEDAVPARVQQAPRAIFVPHRARFDVNWRFSATGNSRLPSV